MQYLFQKSLLLTLTILLFCSCNEEDKKNNSGDNTDNNISVAKSNISDKNSTLYRYLHITNDKVITDNLKLQKDSFAGLDPVYKSDFIIDSTTFATKFYLSDPATFKAPLAFQINLYQMYNMVQKELKLQKIEDGSSGPYNGIRIFPALTTAGGQKVMYLVLVGEKSMPGDPNMIYTMMTEPKNRFYQAINNNLRTLSNKGEKKQAILDMTAYQRFWLDHFGRGTVDTSYNFSISAYYDMLGPDRLNIISDTTNPKTRSGIIFYPCINKFNRLYFVIKGMRTNTSSLKANPFEILDDGYDFYNHMDECPTACPKNTLE